MEYIYADEKETSDLQLAYHKHGYTITNRRCLSYQHFEFSYNLKRCISSLPQKNRNFRLSVCPNFTCHRWPKWPYTYRNYRVLENLVEAFST